MKTNLANPLTRVFVIFIVSFSLTCVVKCRKYEVESELPFEEIAALPLDLMGKARNVDVIGQVIDEAGNPIEGAMVQAGYGRHSVLTDQQGFFRLMDIVGFDNISMVKVSKAGYFNGSRSFVPTNGQNHVRIALLAKNYAGSFNSVSGGQVGLENVTIQFAPGSVGLGGLAYSGNVKVSINSIDPSDPLNMSQQMPGKLIGADSIDLDLPDGFLVLKSFGMVGVELTTNSGQELQLLPGYTATIHFDIPSGLLTDAPSTIPLWYYSETSGFWIREGEATRNGNFYVGEVSHFSFWNCDLPAEAVLFNLRLLDNNANPIEGAYVVITSPTLGSQTGYTDSNGEVSGHIPANELLEVNVCAICGNIEEPYYSTTIGPLSGNLSTSWNIESLSNVALLQGQLTNGMGVPVSGYVYLDDGGFVYTEDGHYELITCTGSHLLSGWYYDENNLCTSNQQSINLIAGLNTVDVTVFDCTTYGQPGAGGVDTEGDLFTSVLIGPQEWMSENLSVASYSDGTPIPEVTDANEWSNLTTGAWCWYNNDSSTYASTYGRLYNWYAVAGIFDAASEANPTLRKQLAPSGWHVPNDLEHSTMINILDIFANGGTNPANTAGGKMKTVGTIEDGTGLWFSPNTNANNMSGFSGVPGGFRNYDGFSAQYVFVGSYGYWWTSSELDAANAWYRLLGYSVASVNRVSEFKQAGCSVRCVRD